MQTVQAHISVCVCVHEKEHRYRGTSMRLGQLASLHAPCTCQSQTCLSTWHRMGKRVFMMLRHAQMRPRSIKALPSVASDELNKPKLPWHAQDCQRLSKVRADDWRLPWPGASGNDKLQLGHSSPGLVLGSSPSAPKRPCEIWLCGRLLTYILACQNVSEVLP